MEHLINFSLMNKPTFFIETIYKRVMIKKKNITSVLANHLLAVVTCKHPS